MDDAVDAAVVTASWRCAQSTNTFSYGHYPNVVIYPPFNNASVTTSVSRRNSARSEYTTNVRSTVSYPYFDICEFFLVLIDLDCYFLLRHKILLHIHSSISTALGKGLRRSFGAKNNLSLCPQNILRSRSVSNVPSIRSSSSYAFVDRPSYPNFDIYNCGTVSNLEPACVRQETRLKARYPTIIICELFLTIFQSL